MDKIILNRTDKKLLEDLELIAPLPMKYFHHLGQLI